MSALRGRGGFGGSEVRRIDRLDADALEPISPELALVDPVLREAAIDRLPPEGAVFQAPAVRPPPPLRAAPAPAPILPPRRPPAPQPTAVRHGRRLSPLRLAPALVPLGLIFGVVVAIAASEIRYQAPTLEPATATATGRTSAPPAPAPTPQSAPKPTPKPTQSRKPNPKARPKPKSKPKQKGAGSHPTRRAPVRETRSAVEQKVLQLVVQAPAGKLPPALIDPRSGLARNGLQAVCRRTAPGSFLCLVAPVRHRPGAGLPVRYRSTRGGGRFTWYAYRH